MKDKKLQVFVSSTYTDLIEERQSAVEAILSSGNIPAGMELFSAGDESQMTVIERWIDESDVYLLILGGRYGSIDSRTGKSYTHLEYEYALSIGKPLFAVVITENTLEAKIKEKGSAVIEKENPKELQVFRQQVLKNLVKFWDDKKDIKLAIHETLSDFSYRKELIGWVRGNNAENSSILIDQISRLTTENDILRKQLEIGKGQDNVFYAGLSYNDLSSFLKLDTFIIKETSKNLFQFFLELGETLSKSNKFLIFDKSQIKISDETEKALIRLTQFKILLKKASTSPVKSIYQFTEDGHNFFLKAIISSRTSKL